MSIVAASAQCTSSRKTTSGRRRQTSRKNVLSSRFKRSCDAACIWGACPGALPAPGDGGLQRLAQGGPLRPVADAAALSERPRREPQLLGRHTFAGGGLEAEATHQLAHTGFRGRAELLADERFVCAAVLQRGGHLAERRERGHDAARGTGAQGIEGGELPPPFQRAAMVAARSGFGRERLEHSADTLPQPAALGFRPALEFRQAIHKEAVEEGTAIDHDRGRRIAPRERIVERLNVAGKDRRIEPQLRGAEEQLRLVQVVAQRVAGLLEQAAAVFGVAVRPEVGDDLVAAQPAWMSSKKRQQGEGLPLRARSRTGRAFLLDG